MEHEFYERGDLRGLYLNVIFFGQRAYGVAAASETFFGKSLDQLSVAEQQPWVVFPRRHRAITRS